MIFTKEVTTRRVPDVEIIGWSNKRRDDGTDDGTPGGRYATGHCPVVVYVRWTHDGTLALSGARFTNYLTTNLRHILP